MRPEPELRRASSPVTLASPWHTAALIAVMLAVATAGTLLEHAGSRQAASVVHPSSAGDRIWGQYLPLLLVNGLLVLYVARLFRQRSALFQLLGRSVRGAADVLVDLLCASLVFVLIVALEALLQPLLAGRNAALSALLPSTEAEERNTGTFTTDDKLEYARRQMGWWYLLMIALIAGIVELYIANNRPQSVRRVG